LEDTLLEAMKQIVLEGNLFVLKNAFGDSYPQKFDLIFDFSKDRESAPSKIKGVYEIPLIKNTNKDSYPVLMKNYLFHGISRIFIDENRSYPSLYHISKSSVGIEISQQKYSITDMNMLEKDLFDQDFHRLTVILNKKL
jgi:hypothetical protein